MSELIYTGCSDIQVTYGGHDDPRELLTVGQSYEVERKDVREWKTHIHLIGIEGRFNSVCFKEHAA